MEDDESDQRRAERVNEGCPLWTSLRNRLSKALDAKQEGAVFKMEQKKPPLADFYASFPKEKNLANLKSSLHEVIDHLAAEAEGLRKFQSYLDIDIDLKDPLEGEEMRYCINVDLGMKLDDIDSISEEVKNTINTNAAAMLRKRFIQLKTDLVRRMEKAENDSLQ